MQRPQRRHAGDPSGELHEDEAVGVRVLDEMQWEPAREANINLRDFLRHPQGRLGYRTAWMVEAKVAATQELQVNIDSHERC